MPAADRERSRFYSTRPRRVPPEFCTDELLESCSLTAALLMYRLISQADDQGRLPGSPKSVRATCFPMRSEITERKVGAAISELVGAGFVLSYEVDGRTYLQIDHWTDLQGRWGRRAYPSRYPAAAGWSGDWVNVKTDDVEEHDERTPGASEMRAVDAQGTRNVRAPITVPLPFSLPFPSPGLSSSAPRGRGWESTGEVLGAMARRADPQGGRTASQTAIQRRSDR
jgi:hypothetical protein